MMGHHPLQWKIYPKSITIISCYVSYMIWALKDGSRNALLYITHGNPLGSLCVLSPHVFMFWVSRFYISQKVNVSTRRHSKRSLTFKSWLQLGPFSNLSKRPVRKERSHHAGGSNALRKRFYFWWALFLPWPILKVKGQMQQPWPEKDIVTKSQPSQRWCCGHPVVNETQRGARWGKIGICSKEEK